MKAEAKLFLGLIVFFVPISIIYGLLTGFTEPVGWMGILLVALTMLMVGGYLWIISKRIDPRPEDDPTANIEDGPSEMGFYSPWSWWPLILAFSAALIFFGLAVGPWISGIGFMLLVVALVGWVYEYSRGSHAH